MKETVALFSLIAVISLCISIVGISGSIVDGIRGLETENAIDIMGWMTLMWICIGFRTVLNWMRRRDE